jgi:hypothetical protein
MFGGADPVRRRSLLQRDIHLDVRAHVHPKFGWFRMSESNDLPVDATSSASLSRRTGYF